ncbi:hypothetical protein [Spongiactinospora sp. TRM90649]|uniref:hypothetical protein n=1 Tax=Spongiactinospora sp. TRM90649 TaxID=3031114 RepID=UPI0023F95F4F|nr:hypothetical protein [Spongiactinospora sp. TRM90649]MDF5755827.1 hypothetical protein [Spongiactinospora sp. TRM90649]
MTQAPDMPRLVVDVAFSVGANLGTALHLDDASRGRLDTGTLATSDTWVEVSADVKVPSTRTQRGSTRVESPLIHYEPGSATVVMTDPDRRFDPTNLAGPYVSGGRSQVTAMRAIRLRAVWDNVAYPLFRGFADSWDLDWGPTLATVTVPCTDAFKALAAKRRSAVAPAGGGENVAARIHRVLDSADWPAEDRLIGTGSTALQATTLEGDPLAEARLAVDSEIGELYADAEGRVRFRGRLALLTDPRSATSQATFGAEPGVVELPISTDDAQLYNEVKITRVDGAEQVATDPGSMDEFLPHTFERSDLLMTTDAEAADYAAWLLYISAEPEVRFDKIVIYPRRNPAVLWPQVLGREIGDRITCVRVPPTGGDPVVRDCFIRGIEHEVEDQRWRTTWHLQSATKIGSFLTLDHLTTGRLSFNALAY